MVQLLKEFDFSLTFVKKFQKMKGNPAGKLPMNRSSSLGAGGKSLQKKPSLPLPQHVQCLMFIWTFCFPCSSGASRIVPRLNTLFHTCLAFVHSSYISIEEEPIPVWSMIFFFISIKLNVFFEFWISYNMKISPKLSSSGLKFKVTLASQIRLIFFF